MRVRGKQIFPPVVIEIGKACSPAAVILSESSQAAGICGVNETSLSGVAKQREGLVSQCYDGDIRPAIVIVIAKVRAHAGDRLAIAAQRNSGKKCGLFKSAIAPVVEQEIGHVVVGDENIGVAIMVVIRESNAHTAPRKCRDAGLFGHVLESAIAAIAIESACQPVE